MSPEIRLKFKEFDDRGFLYVGHGDGGVLIQIFDGSDDTDNRHRRDVLILSADEAYALGTRLRQQANAAKRAHKERDDVHAGGV